MSSSTPKSYSSDPTLWLYTSLSSGSSHIVTATSRLETILKANKVPFQALDVATDEKARMLWGRRAGKRKLPGLVRMGLVVADLEEVEEWNEYGEIKENLGSTAAPSAPVSTPSASASNTPSKPAPAAPPMPGAKPTPTISATTNPSISTSKAELASGSAPKSPPPSEEKPSLAGQMRNMGAEVAEKAKQMRTAKLKAMAAGTSTSRPSPSKTEEASEGITDSEAKEGHEDEESGKETEVYEGTAGAESEQSSAEQKGSLAKLDNSAPAGMPPPSGETSALDAAAPETRNAVIESKTDAVPETGDEENNTSERNKPTATTIPPNVNALADQVDAQGPESPLPQTENPMEENSIIKTESESVAAESTSSLPATPQHSTHHHGSSISMASKEEIKKIEEATKIQEESSEEGEENEKEAFAKGEESAASGKAVNSPGSSAPEEKNEESHVKFGGEAQGEEIDRVKATLERNSPQFPLETSQSENKDVKKELDPAAASSSDKAEDLPGTKTQSQEAADPGKVGESVAD